MGARGLAREVGLGLVTAGVVVLLFVVYELVGTNLAEQASQARLAKSFDAALAQTAHHRAAANPGSTHRGSHHAGPIPAKRGHGVVGPAKSETDANPPPIAAPIPGGALDRMSIPAIGLLRYVVEGVSDADLQMGPGHYPTTPVPGRTGNVGIAGHRTTFGAPFFRLNELVRGDLIYLTDTSGTTWIYKVTSNWVVPPSDIAVLAPTRDPELTLTTCNPRFEATSRLVVRAILARELAAEPLAALHPKLRPKVAGGKKTATTSTSKPPTSTTTPATRTTKPATAPKPLPIRATGGLRLGTGGLSAWWGTTGWALLALAGWAATRLTARHRHRYGQALVITLGALACLVPLWFTFENLVRLLPANI